MRKIKLKKSNDSLKKDLQELFRYTEKLHLDYKRFRNYVKLCVIRCETPDANATQKDIKDLFIKHCAKKENKPTI